MIDWTVPHTICGIGELDSLRDRGITHMLSILDPHYPDPVADYPPHARLVLRFDDGIAPAPGLILPEPGHVEELLAFGRTLPGGDPAHLLVHCHAGVSRSTAAMTALLVQAHPEADEDTIFDHVARIRPQAWPNSRIIGFADTLLGRDGRLTAALRRLYGRQLPRLPVGFADELRSYGRGAEVEMAV